MNEDNPNISPFAIKNVTFGTSRRELHGADTNWLDVGRNELRIDLQDPMGGDAHVLIEYQNIADGSVRLINHSGAILRFDVPVKHVKLNDLSAEASQVVLSSAPEDSEQPWAIWIWLKGDGKARRRPATRARALASATRDWRCRLARAREQDYGRMAKVLREVMPVQKMNEDSDSQLSQPPEPEPPLRSPSSSVSETPNKASEKTSSKMSAATTQLPHAAPVPDALQLLGEGSGRDDDHFDNEGRADGGTAADTTVEPSDRFEKPLSNSTEPDLEAQEDQARGAGKSIFRTSAEKERELASRSPAYQDDEIDDSEQQFLPPASAVSNADEDDVDEDDDSDYEASQQQPKRTPANGSRRGTQTTAAKQPVTLKKAPTTKPVSAKPQWTEEMTFELIGTILDCPGNKKKEIIETFKRELEQKRLAVASPADTEISKQITKVASFDRSLKQFMVSEEYERLYWDRYDVGTGKSDGETTRAASLTVSRASDRGARFRAAAVSEKTSPTINESQFTKLHDTGAAATDALRSKNDDKATRNDTVRSTKSPKSAVRAAPALASTFRVGNGSYDDDVDDEEELQSPVDHDDYTPIPTLPSRSAPARAEVTHSRHHPAVGFSDVLDSVAPHKSPSPPASAQQPPSSTLRPALSSLKKPSAGKQAPRTTARVSIRDSRTHSSFARDHASEEEEDDDMAAAVSFRGQDAPSTDSSATASRFPQQPPRSRPKRSFDSSDDSSDGEDDTQNRMYQVILAQAVEADNASKAKKVRKLCAKMEEKGKMMIGSLSAALDTEKEKRVLASIEGDIAATCAKVEEKVEAFNAAKRAFDDELEKYKHVRVRMERDLSAAVKSFAAHQSTSKKADSRLLNGYEEERAKIVRDFGDEARKSKKSRKR